MAEYHDSKSLEGNYLAYGDTIYFHLPNKKLIYKVCLNLCKYLNGYQALNDTIFKELHIKDIYKFCSILYGYDSKFYINGWPATNPEDIPALTRVVIALFKRIEKEFCKETEDSNIIFENNDVKVLPRNGNKSAPIASSYNIGDKVIYKDLESTVLGFSSSWILIYLEKGHNGWNNAVDKQGNPITLSSDSGYYVDVEELSPVVYKSKPQQQEEVILRYKNTIVTKTKNPPIDVAINATRGYNIGDIVNLAHHGETCILGFSLKANKVIVYRDPGLNLMSYNIYTASGEPVTFAGLVGWVVSYNDISKVENVQEELIVTKECELTSSDSTQKSQINTESLFGTRPQQQAINISVPMVAYSKRNYNISNSISTIQITISKNKYHI